MNSIVAENGLNEIAKHLPDFADRHNSGVLSLSRAQGDAVQRWRDAAEQIDPLWRVYVAIATLEGHDDTGRVTADTRSAGLRFACRLGNPGTFSTADAAATTLVSASEGTDAAKRWGPLLPFAVPAIHGYALNFHTSADAAAIRLAIQPAA